MFISYILIRRKDTYFHYYYCAITYVLTTEQVVYGWKTLKPGAWQCLLLFQFHFHPLFHSLHYVSLPLFTYLITFRLCVLFFSLHNTHRHDVNTGIVPYTMTHGVVHQVCVAINWNKKLSRDIGMQMLQCSWPWPTT